NLLSDVEKETNVIVSCSLLKKSYRDFFIKDDMILVYIKVAKNACTQNHHVLIFL
mgnify:CR=1